MSIRATKHALIIFLLTIPAFTQTWTEFALASKGLGTRPTALNSSGEVAGWYNTTGSNGHLLGFVRDADGTIVKLSGPTGTYLTPTAINSAGLVAGDMLSLYNSH